jgi:hypothetical protein
MNTAIASVKSLKIDLSFEEALEPSLAVQSCLHSLNRYNRSTTQGRAMGLMLSVETDNSTAP